MGRSYLRFRDGRRDCLRREARRLDQDRACRRNYLAGQRHHARRDRLVGFAAVLVARPRRRLALLQEPGALRVGSAVGRAGPSVLGLRSAGVVSAATIPACLTRTTADDRDEAARSIQPAYTHAVSRAGEVVYDGCTELEAARLAVPGDTVTLRPGIGGAEFDAALAEIQRREAEALYHLVTWNPNPFSLARLAYNATAAARAQTAEDALLTLSQRATLLDCARQLVRLALEVSGAK